MNAFLARNVPRVRSLLRIVAGFLFACHGVAGLFGVLGGAPGPGNAAIALGAWPSWWAALIECVTGVLLVLGFLTRPSALVASGTMAYAYFTVHQPGGLFPLVNGGEKAALFSWIFLTIAFAGPGCWAVDHVVSRMWGRDADPPAPRPHDSVEAPVTG